MKQATVARETKKARTNHLKEVQRKADEFCEIDADDVLDGDEDSCHLLAEDIKGFTQALIKRRKEVLDT